MSDATGPGPSAGAAAAPVIDPGGQGGRPSEGSDPVAGLCPYLIAVPGDWRATMPAKEHTCGAVDPAVPVSLDKQRRLCLGLDHGDCATYRAARRALLADDTGSAARTRDREQRWPIAATAPVVLDRGGPSLSIHLDRTAGQVGLVLLMVIAFVVLGVARLSAEGPTVASPGPTASAVPTAGTSPRPSATARATPRPSSSVAPSGSAVPSGSVAPSGAIETYVVQPGDTLGAIAERFGTTVDALQQLNGIEDPSLIRSGQELQLP